MLNLKNRLIHFAHLSCNFTSSKSSKFGVDFRPQSPLRHFGFETSNVSKIWNMRTPQMWCSSVYCTELWELGASIFPLSGKEADKNGLIARPNSSAMHWHINKYKFGRLCIRRPRRPWSGKNLLLIKVNMADGARVANG